MIVLDASVVIAHLDPLDALHRRATALLLEHADEPLRLAVVTRAEVLVRPAQTGMLDAVVAALDRLDIHTPRLGTDDAARIAQLRAETGLQLPGCCVLLEAERADAALATFDTRLGAAASARGLRVIG